jgi:nucleoside-diphosphate kinase
MKLLNLTRAQAEEFYSVHAGRPFYEELVEFMTEGPIVAVAFEGDDAVARWRKIMGDTDPADAAEGTIRGDLAQSKGRNCSHGSDSAENAALELKFFFSELELVSAPER